MNRYHEDEAVSDAWRNVTADVLPMQHKNRMATPPDSLHACRERVKKRLMAQSSLLHDADIYSLNKHTSSCLVSSRATMQEVGALQMDAKLQKRLSKGVEPIDAVLDLHGLTAEVAYEKLYRFVERAVHFKYRTLLIITGKGRDGEGVLRQLLPMWLDNLTACGWVQSGGVAAARHGGSGAYYVRLRRQDREVDRDDA